MTIGALPSQTQHPNQIMTAQYICEARNSNLTRAKAQYICARTDLRLELAKEIQEEGAIIGRPISGPLRMHGEGVYHQSNPTGSERNLESCRVDT